MTKRPDVYTTLGLECGCCGHRHPTVREAGQCFDDYRRRGVLRPDRGCRRRAAAWPPTEGRYLNDAELEAL